MYYKVKQSSESARNLFECEQTARSEVNDSTVQVDASHSITIR